MPHVKWEVTMDGRIEGKMHKLVYGLLNGYMDGWMSVDSSKVLACKITFVATNTSLSACIVK